MRIYQMLNRTIRNWTLAAAMIAVPAISSAGVFISVGIAPPVLPVYEQPLCPAAGYIWTPGYWGYQDGGYYWVPGTWVLAPTPGFLWTPAWWGWSGGVYVFHAGYWGPHVGFYGGINYGFGYTGHGYFGGRWDHGVFQYNREVNHINVTNIHNVYNERVVNNNVTRVSYNGGAGGINARATQQEMAAEHDRHIGATSMQAQHEHAASTNRAQFASVNHGRPSVVATARPGAFNGAAAVHSGAPGRTFGQNTAHSNGNANHAQPAHNVQQAHNVQPAHNAQSPHNASAPNRGEGQRFGQNSRPAAQTTAHNQAPHASAAPHGGGAPAHAQSAPRGGGGHEGGHGEKK